MGNGGSSSSNGPGVANLMSVAGMLPEFVDYYDRRDGEWKVAQVVRYSSDRNKIKTAFVAKEDRREYVSDWLRLGSTRLAPNGMFTSEKKKERQEECNAVVMTTPKNDKRNMTALRKRELSDLGKGLQIAASLNVDDNTQIASKKISVGDFVDVLNRNFRWEPASVRDLAIREGRAHALIRRERSSSLDREEWVPFESNRIAPFGKKVGCKHHAYHKGQLVDVLHKFIASDGSQHSKWRNGEILDTTDYQVNVRYLAFSLDEWIDVSRSPGRERVEHAFSHTKGSPGALKREKADLAFRSNLKQLGFKVLTMENDGNCLFRAVALQVLGDVSMHGVVRQKCCEHLRVYKDHFAGFVDAGDGSNFEDYVQRMARDATWGGHAEIQAIEEIWDRQIFVFRSDERSASGISGPAALSPVTLGEDVEPIRLSYHGKSHYNALMKLASSQSFPLQHRSSNTLLLARKAATKSSPTTTSASKSDGDEDNFEKETSAYMSSATKISASESMRVVGGESPVESNEGADKKSGPSNIDCGADVETDAATRESGEEATTPEWGWKTKSSKDKGDCDSESKCDDDIARGKGDLLAKAEW